MIISIVSGKGGTGKTTVATNLALFLNGGVQLLDCDVEEPNAHLFMKPEIQERQNVFIKVPEIDQDKCILCGKCQEVCAFNAIAVMKDRVLLFPELCHSCGSCSYFCPQKALKEVDKGVGAVNVGVRGGIQFVSGELLVGQAVSIPVIKAVKSLLNPSRTVIIDAPPGTSCPVIASVTGSDYVLVVTEPTPFGFNDFRLVVDLLKELSLPFGVLVNRCDLGNRVTEEFCLEHKIPVLAKIPFQKEIAAVYSEGGLVTEKIPELKSVFQEIAARVQKEISK